jgi:hypothetical protein
MPLISRLVVALVPVFLALGFGRGSQQGQTAPSAASLPAGRRSVGPSGPATRPCPARGLASEGWGVGLSGLEPLTSALSGRPSRQSLGASTAHTVQSRPVESPDAFRRSHSTSHSATTDSLLANDDRAASSSRLGRATSAGRRPGG